MRLSPTPLRHPRPNSKRVTWSDKQHKIVTDLVSEANALMNIFDQVTMLLGPDIRLNPAPKLDETPIPIFQMDSLLKNSCDVLEEKIKNLNPIQLIETKIMKDELLKYSNNDIELEFMNNTQC